MALGPKSGMNENKIVGHFRSVSQCVWFSHKVAIKNITHGSFT